MSEFDYRKFLAENKLTKVSKGRETGKAKILSEGLQILEEGEQWVGKFTTDTYRDLVQAVQNAQGKCSFNLNGKDFTVRPKGERFLVTSGVGDFGYEAMDTEGACKAAYRYSTGNLKEGFDTEMDDLDECGDFDMMEANAQKDAYFKRKEREKRGNWGGSVGAFVEKHGEDLGRVGTNRQALVDYIETTMKPELNDEAKAYVDDLVATTKSSFKLLQALYNATMAGSGLSTGAGSLREEDWEGDDSLYESISASKKYPQEKGSRTSVTSKKYKGKKAGDGQDRMAKSEMTGEKMDVTIGGVTKSISTREYKKYRKMTDPEEKKAWKKKYGFVK